MKITRRQAMRITRRDIRRIVRESYGHESIVDRARGHHDPDDVVTYEVLWKVVELLEKRTDMMIDELKGDAARRQLREIIKENMRVICEDDVADRNMSRLAKWNKMPDMSPQELSELETEGRVSRLRDESGDVVYIDAAFRSSDASLGRRASLAQVRAIAQDEGVLRHNVKNLYREQEPDWHISRGIYEVS